MVTDVYPSLPPVSLLFILCCSSINSSRYHAIKARQGGGSEATEAFSLFSIFFLLTQKPLFVAELRTLAIVFILTGEHSEQNQPNVVCKHTEIYSFGFIVGF